MNISPVSAKTFAPKAAIKFKGNREENTKSTASDNQDEYYNPVSVKTERNLAILSSVGTSGVVGAVVAGIVSALKNEDTKLFSKVPILAGIAAAAGTLALTLPSSLYHTKVNATVKEKEMDVFTRDKELKKDLTKEVHDAVKDPEVSLDDKLNHNLKLQAGNRASTLGITQF